jgi:succinoglycan biosynthesis transport protein ExoP
VVPEAGVALLAAGGRVANPSELLGSPRMAEVLSQLEGQFDVVILDCPPVLPVSDPLVLAVNATGVIVVVRLGTTSRDRLRRALASLAKLNVPILGLVANGAVAGGDAAYGYGAKYGYDQTPIASGRRGRRRDRQSPAVPTGAMVSGPSDE